MYSKDRKNKKKLLIFTWDMGLGGVQKRVRDVLADMGKNNCDWDITLLLLKKQEPLFEVKSMENITVLVVPKMRILRRFTAIFSFLYLAACILKIRPNVCLTFLEKNSLMMATLKKFLFFLEFRLVLNEGNLTTLNLKTGNPRIWKLWAWLVSISYPVADRIIVPSRACRDDLVNNFRIDQKKITVIYNWTLFTQHKLKNITISRREYDIIFVGRISSQKRPLDMLDGFYKMLLKNKKLKMCVLGDGSMLQDFLDYGLKLGIMGSVEYVGLVKNVSDYIQNSKILWLFARHEGMPNVVLEAAALGVPSIVSDFPGAREVVEDGVSGYVCDDDDAILSRTEQLLSNPALVKKMGAEARRHIVSNFSVLNQKLYIKKVLYG